MAATSTLLCIHRDPAQLSLLQENGYELVTATNGHDGLRLFMTRAVDAIVLEYHLGLLDGSVVAAEIKQVRPEVPIVMLTEHMELPAGALKSVDAHVIKSDGPHSLLATVHSVLGGKAQRGNPVELKAQTAMPPPSSDRPPGTAGGGQADPAKLSTMEGKATPFSQGVWQNIRNGTIQF